MRLQDQSVLDRFRGPGRCEVCARKCYRDPHHVYTKGAGGPDIPINILGICRKCHSEIHDGNIPRSRLETIIALREGIQAEDIRTEVDRIRLLPKPPSDVPDRPLTKKRPRKPPEWKEAARAKQKAYNRALRKKLLDERKIKRKEAKK